jgi:hypothetical protein
MAVSDGSGNFCSVVEETEDTDDAVEDVMFSSPPGRGDEAAARPDKVFIVVFYFYCIGVTSSFARANMEWLRRGFRSPDLLRKIMVRMGRTCKNRASISE